MRRFVQAAALLGVGAMIGYGVVIVNAGASPSVPPKNTMLNVTGTAIGRPQPVRVAASGFVPGSLVFIEQCDGNDAATTVGWSPTSNCDLGSSPSPVQADANGRAIWQPDNPNFAFTPFKGESPQSLFNCLSAHEAALSPTNGLPDFENCQVRVSSNNTSATSDQQFFDLSLPDAPWEALAHPTGACTGQRVLGKWTTALSNTAANNTLGTALLKDTTSHLPISGTCNVPGATGLTPKSFAMKVVGSAKCTATADDAPLVGKLSITMSQIDPATGKNYVVQAYVRRTPGVDPNAKDIVLYQGQVSSGRAAGSTIVGTLYEDPIVKAPKGVVTSTGYVDAHNDLTACQSGSATIATVEVGSGPSKFGGTASGLIFGY